MSGVQTKILKFKSSFAVFQTDSEVRCFLFIFINVITTNCIFTIRVLRLMGQSCIWCLQGECWNLKSHGQGFSFYERGGVLGIRSLLAINSTVHIFTGYFLFKEPSWPSACDLQLWTSISGNPSLTCFADHPSPTLLPRSGEHYHQ